MELREASSGEIRLGVCADLKLAAGVARTGYDYIEGNLTNLAKMDDQSFDALWARMRELPIRAEVFNCMLPSELSVTGPNVNAGEIHAYLDRAYDRAVKLGCEVVVFGSGAARTPPEDWPMDVAWRQIVNFLRMAERHNAAFGITLAIEPLRRQESSVLNLVTEAAAIASIVHLPHIRVLADTYHMAMSHEPLSVFPRAKELLAHVHTANSIGRTFPKQGDGEDYRALFAALLDIGYEGRVSVEGGCEDFATESAQAIEVLREARSMAI